MELEYSDKNSRRSKVYIAVGLVVAMVVGATVFVALQASGLTAESDVEMRSVVVAVRDIPARKAIEEGDVSVREVVADQTNETAFTRLDEVLGRVAGIPGRDRAARDPQRPGLDDGGPGVLDPRCRRRSSTRAGRTGARSASRWPMRTPSAARSCPANWSISSSRCRSTPRSARPRRVPRSRRRRSSPDRPRR